MSKTKQVLRNLGLWIGAGVLAGAAATVFLYLLAWATDTREAHRPLIWGLPLAGLFIGWAYHRHGAEAARGNNLILDEIHDPRKVLPWRMSPLVLFGTVITHLFGGSAGREGTAVQMGASLADRWGSYFRITPAQRKTLLVAGAGAGFGAAIGTPLAGAIFGMEVIEVGRLRLFAPLPCLIASYVAYFTSHALGAPHTHYPEIAIPDFRPLPAGAALVLGLASGLVARFFVYFTHLVEKAQSHLRYPPLRPLVGGLILVALYFGEGSYLYTGLGIPVIQTALTESVPFRYCALKFLFTALTLGSGFKGGEFIPMVFMGATLGSALAPGLHVSPAYLGALGFAAVFGAGANTPLACAVMACEIFGLPLLPAALLACFVAYYVSGHPGIYHAQPLARAKRVRLPTGLFG